jgi:hypothetical protein
MDCHRDESEGFETKRNIFVAGMVCTLEGRMNR